MRTAMVVAALVFAGCLRIEGERTSNPDAGMEDDAGAPDASADPCVWDGLGDGRCFADTASVFDGTSCRTVCGAQPSPGRTGVFASQHECETTCPCAPEKFGGAEFAVGAYCDQIVTRSDGGAPPPWPGLECTSVSTGDEQCALSSSPRPLDRAAMAMVCRASAQPQVRSVLCVVFLP